MRKLRHPPSDCSFFAALWAVLRLGLAAFRRRVVLNLLSVLELMDLLESYEHMFMVIAQTQTCVVRRTRVCGDGSGLGIDASVQNSTRPDMHAVLCKDIGNSQHSQNTETAKTDRSA